MGVESLFQFIHAMMSNNRLFVSYSVNLYETMVIKMTAYNIS